LAPAVGNAEYGCAGNSCFFWSAALPLAQIQSLVSAAHEQGESLSLQLQLLDRQPSISDGLLDTLAKITTPQLVLKFPDSNFILDSGRVNSFSLSGNAQRIDLDTLDSIRFNWNIKPAGLGKPVALADTLRLDISLRTGVRTATGGEGIVFIWNPDTAKLYWEGTALLANRDSMTAVLVAAGTDTSRYFVLSAETQLCLEGWPAPAALAYLRQEMKVSGKKGTVQSSIIPRIDTLQPDIILQPDTLDSSWAVPPVIKLVNSILADFSLQDRDFTRDSTGFDSLVGVRLELVSAGAAVPDSDSVRVAFCSADSVSLDVSTGPLWRELWNDTNFITKTVVQGGISHTDTTDTLINQRISNWRLPVPDSLSRALQAYSHNSVPLDTFPSFVLRAGFTNPASPALRVDSLRLTLIINHYRTAGSPDSLQQTVYRSFSARAFPETLRTEIADPAVRMRSIYPGQGLRLLWTRAGLQTLTPGYTPEQVFFKGCTLQVAVDTSFPPLSTSLDFDTLSLEWDLANWKLTSPADSAAINFLSRSQGQTDSSRALVVQKFYPGWQKSFTIDLTNFVNHMAFFPALDSLELEIRLRERSKPGIIVYDPLSLRLRYNFVTRVVQ
jgi:hypothetical protein